MGTIDLIFPQCFPVCPREAQCSVNGEE